MEHNVYMQEFENIMRNYPLSIMAKEWKPVIPYRREKYLTPDDIKDLVTRSPRIIGFIEQLCMGNQRMRSETQKLVKKMLDEIGTKRSMTAVRWFGVIIENLIKRYVTLHVNATKVHSLKLSIGRNPVIYLLSHRSYADFTLFSYVCFYYDIEIPTIAAGIDFLSMKVVGELMRKAGAFYMRRSFAHDKLYWYVLKEYVQNLVKHFHSGMEFFLEGTRSRSMKALPPKVGLLSMAVEPFFMGELSDITIVPVSISYERPLEEKLFVDELMGVPKPKETTVGLIKSLREISNNEYGKIYIRVQDSMSLRKYVKERTDRMKYSVEPAHVQTLATDDMAVVQDLAYYIIDLQQKFIVIHLINLVTLYVAFRRFSMKDTITLVELCDGVLLLSRIFERMGAITNVDPSKIRQDIQTTLRIHKRIFAVENDCLVLKKPLVEVDKIKNMRFKAHRLNDGSMQQCVPVFSLQIYINPCLYWTALPTIILVSQKQLSDNGSVPVDVNVLRGKVQLLRKLYEREFVFYEKQEEQEFFEKLNQLQNFNLLEYVPNRDEVVYNKDASDLEKYLMSVLSPYVTTYYQVVTILGQYFNEDQEFTENEFLVKMQMEMEFRLAHQQEFIHPYALCLETLSNALHSLVALKAVQKERDPKKTTFQIVRPNLLPFVDLLRSICQLMPFNYLYDYNPVSSLAYKL